MSIGGAQERQVNVSGARQSACVTRRDASVQHLQMIVRVIQTPGHNANHAVLWEALPQVATFV